MARVQHQIQPQTTSWRFYTRPQETWDAMYEDCVHARHSIEFEQYILENDSVGRRFMELFIEKAKAGIKIFLICDKYGSQLLCDSPLVRQLRRHGGHVHFYNAWGGWKRLTPWLWLPRTHTKTLLVDSRIAYTGGVCIAERMRHWRDTHMRITGPVIAQVRQAFDDIERKVSRRWRLKKAKERPPQDSAEGGRFSYFLNRPLQRRHAIYKELLAAVTKAEKYIYITTAFFVPDRRFLALLKKAHDRGVDIRVLVPERSDVLPADWICLSYTPRFLRAGLRVYHYQENILHSKTAIIDDSWGTVGSTNFDLLSFFHNREANIITTDREAIAALKEQFFRDLDFSAEITRHNFRNVPRWKIVLGYVTRIMKVFL